MTDEELGRVLKALADPNRRRILQLIADQKQSCPLNGDAMNCSVIVGQMNISQPTVSHHLKELVHAGLITMESSGTSALLTLRRDTLSAAITQLQQMFLLSE